MHKFFVCLQPFYILFIYITNHVLQAKYTLLNASNLENMPTQELIAF